MKKVKRIFLEILTINILLFIFLQFYSTSVAVVDINYTLSYTGIESVEGGSINITDVNWASPTSYECSDNLIAYQTSSVFHFYWDEMTIYPGDQITANYSLVYDNVGYDAEGESIDLYITDNIVSNISSNVTFSSLTLAGSTYACFTGESSGRLFADSYGIPVAHNLKIEFIRSSDGEEAVGNFLFYVSDVDVYTSFYGVAVYERITFSDTHTNTVYVNEDSWLEIGGGSIYNPTKVNDSSDNSIYTALTTIMDSRFF